MLFRVLLRSEAVVELPPVSASRQIQAGLGELEDQRPEEVHRLLDELGEAIVELKYFGGLTSEETAEALGVSLATVKRDRPAAMVAGCNTSSSAMPRASAPKSSRMKPSRRPRMMR